MLSLSATSGTTYGSSSLSQDVDLEVIEEIVDRAPRTATTFPPVYRAYGEVLQENGLSASDDTVYYQFLLKLGVIRAATWGERWDIWKASNPNDYNANQQGSKSHAHTHGRSLSGGNRLLEVVRDRVPFLASASSDLDYGFAEGNSEIEEGEGESGAGYGTPNVMASRQARPSPRKVMGEKSHSRSRSSLVGYTPSQSLEHDYYDLISLHDPPIRTSTPVFAQNVYGAHESSPPLPTYTESELSARTGSHADEEEGETTLTPRARAMALTGSGSGSAGDDSGIPDFDLELETELDEDVLREMEKRAEEFYETGLRGRCWDVWVQSTDWVLKTTHQIDTVRSNLLLRQVFTKWQAICEHHLSLPNTADSHRAYQQKSQALRLWMQRLKDKKLVELERAYHRTNDERILKRVWRGWRRELIQRRTERWTKDMKHKERAFIRRKEELLLDHTMRRWQDALDDRVDGRLADDHYHRGTLQTTLSYWHSRATQKRTLGDLLNDYDSQRTTGLLHETFDLWHRRATLVTRERQHIQNSTRKLIQSAWEQWRLGREWRSQALDVFEKHGLRRAFGKWRRSLKNVKGMQQHATALAGARNQALLSDTLHIWVTSERGVLLKSVLETRTIRSTWERWKRKTASTNELQDQAVSLQERKSDKILQAAFSRWKSKRAIHETHASQAAALYISNLSRSTWRTWTTTSQRLQMHRENADKAHEYFVQRSVWKCWKRSLAAKRRDAWVRDKEIKRLKEVFNDWTEATVRSVGDRRMVTAFERKHDMALVQRVLASWTHRVIEIKSRELDITDRRDDALLRDSMTRWRKAAKRVSDLKGLMYSFRDLKVEDSLRVTLLFWRDAARRSQFRKEKLKVAEEARDSELKKFALGHWNERYKERTLAPIAQEVALRHEDALLFSVWDQWKGRSTYLRAVVKNNQRLKRVGWSRWQRATELALSSKRAKAVADRRVLHDIFAVWHEAAKQKSSLRTTRIRGRIRPISFVEPPPPRAPVGTHSRRMIPPYSYPGVIPASPNSVASEPAYSRLRTELGRRRGGSEEPEPGSESESRGRRGSGLINALKGNLGV